MSSRADKEKKNGAGKGKKELKPAGQGESGEGRVEGKDRGGGQEAS
jgi:hypothetical protein